MNAPQSSYGDPGYTRDESISPTVHPAPMGGYGDPVSTFGAVSPHMSTHMPLISPDAHGQHVDPHGHVQHGVVMMGQHQQSYVPMAQHQHHNQQPMVHQQQPNYPPHAHNPNWQRHHSISGSDSPHIVGADVFGGPLPPPPRTAMSEPGIMMEPQVAGSSQSHMISYEYMHDASFTDIHQGISPARALGPAPAQLAQFATPSTDAHKTPTNASGTYKPPIMSSSSMGSSTDNSSSVDRPGPSRHHMASTSDDDNDNDSPTKRVRDRIPTFDPESRAPRKAAVAAVPGRPMRPPAKQPVVASGSRTSAKFAKVAEDPGVEGVPPGPRPTERPQQSFACIIGQAILKSQAGGLSLEHIYRYVETAYPYFRTIDQWRNSIRHNLSIHKIFSTIPRTEKHPPGKGGIWVIDECEKIHWPSEGKFIKNFPASHPHHAVCKQTLHERKVEQRDRERAAAEGREYMPKKGKKGRGKMAVLKDDDVKAAELLPPPPPPQASLAPINKPVAARPPVPMPPALPPVNHNHNQGMPAPVAQSMPAPAPPPSSPPMAPKLLTSSQHEFEDDSDFVPMEQVEPTPAQRLFATSSAPPKHENGKPGHFRRASLNSKRSIRDDDDENVFGNSSSAGPKRVRMSQADPLSPILEQQPTRIPEVPTGLGTMSSELLSAAFLNDDDNIFITPSRERERPSHGHSMLSSALKTPALVQTSSSPTSSPMPPTVGRSHHHPSSLQQAWTHDDMVSTTPTSPAKLDAAFDLKPAPAKRPRDENDVPSLAPPIERGPPKTPVSRSSAATDRTPRPIGGLRTPMVHKTPLSYGSPAVPNSTNAHLSTPMWEIHGVLNRFGSNDHAESPTRTPRSDVPPTSPTHYSLGDGDSPVAKRRRVPA